MRTRGWQACAALGALVLTCAIAPRPPAPVNHYVPNARPMAVAPAEWAYLRAEHDSAEACTHRARGFDRITWMVVPGRDFRVPGDTANKGYLIGYWVKPDTIYVATEWLSSWVPKHEMIHDLLQRDHFDGDTAVWGSACHAMWGYLR